VEVVPYVQSEGDDANILFVPSTRLVTEIVARTAVTVTYRQGDTQPSTTVETTSLDEIEENIQNISNSRVWTLADTEAAFQADGSAGQLALLKFAKEYSYQGQVLAKTATKTPAFGFYIPVKNDQDRLLARKVFSSQVAHHAVGIYHRNVTNLLPEDIKEEFYQRLRSTFGEHQDLTKSDLNITWSDMEDKIDDFIAIMLWLQEATASVEI